jgi:2Fe-2S ferredoxin
MARITYIEPSGNAVTLAVPDGWSLMQSAVANGVAGMVGECGGSCTCATCHGYVDPARLFELPPPSRSETAMLTSVAAERRPNSRLCCQIRSGPTLDGLVVTMPEVQR